MIFSPCGAMSIMLSFMPVKVFQRKLSKQKANDLLSTWDIIRHYLNPGLNLHSSLARLILCDVYFTISQQFDKKLKNIIFVNNLTTELRPHQGVRSGSIEIERLKPNSVVKGKKDTITEDHLKFQTFMTYFQFLIGVN